MWPRKLIVAVLVFMYHAVKYDNKAYRPMFAVEANNNEMTSGYYVNICSVRDGDDFIGLDRSQ